MRVAKHCTWVEWSGSDFWSPLKASRNHSTPTYSRLSIRHIWCSLSHVSCAHAKRKPVPVFIVVNVVNANPLIYCTMWSEIQSHQRSEGKGSTESEVAGHGFVMCCEATVLHENLWRSCGHKCTGNGLKSSAWKSTGVIFKHRQIYTFQQLHLCK